MDSKTALVLIGLGTAISTTTTQAAESIAQHIPRELTHEEMDKVTAGIDPVTVATLSTIVAKLGLVAFDVAVFCGRVDCTQLVMTTNRLYTLLKQRSEAPSQRGADAGLLPQILPQTGNLNTSGSPNTSPTPVPTPTPPTPTTSPSSTTSPQFFSMSLGQPQVR